MIGFAFQMYVWSEVTTAIVCSSVRVCVTDLSRSKAVAPFLTRPREDVLTQLIWIASACASRYHEWYVLWPRDFRYLGSRLTTCANLEMFCCLGSVNLTVLRSGKLIASARCERSCWTLKRCWCLFVLVSDMFNHGMTVSVVRNAVGPDQFNSQRHDVTIVSS